MQLQPFRQQLYSRFAERPDAIMELIDALASNTAARSVVELSLNPCFRRGYSSVHDAIGHVFQASTPQQAEPERHHKELGLMRIIARTLPRPQERTFWLFGMDTTSVPRPFSDRLADRGYVYHPNALAGNKPVTLGHRYSVVAFLPEKADADPSWVVPLMVRRVPTTGPTETQVGAKQGEAVVGDATLPFHHHLCVEVVDSRYSSPEFLGQMAKQEHLVTLARLRGNRVLYRPAQEVSHGRGHPKGYGERFALEDPSSWGDPEEEVETPHTSKRGRRTTVQIQAWHHLLMRGKKGIPMHRHPFTLVRIRFLDAQGQPVFKRTLWLVVMGKRRQELSLLEVEEAYLQRFDLEHFFRFGKQKLLLARYQTPDVEPEENWWQLVLLAYVQGWLARGWAEAVPRPWERYLPKPRGKMASPATVQRDFGRIIRQMGTPAKVPKPRGKSPGRIQGSRLVPRKRHPVVKKRKKAPQAVRKSA